VGAEADGLLAGALERTLAAGTARLTLTRHYDLTASVPVLRRQGGIVNSAVRRALGGTLSVRVDRGAIDFAGARCALAGERRSRIVAGDSEWTGRPGAHVENAAEDARKRQRVVDLVGQIAAAGGAAGCRRRARRTR